MYVALIDIFLVKKKARKQTRDDDEEKRASAKDESERETCRVYVKEESVRERERERGWVRKRANQIKKKRMKEEVIRDRVVKKKKSRDKVTKEKQQYWTKFLPCLFAWQPYIAHLRCIVGYLVPKNDQRKWTVNCTWHFVWYFTKSQ